MHRLTDLFRGLAALLAGLALLVGVPALLIAMVGWPLPTTSPSLELIKTHLSDGDLPDEFVIKFLAVVVWIGWTQLAVGLLVEGRAALAGHAARRAPIMPGIQLLAAKLVTWATLVLTALSPARPVLAAPLAPLPIETTLVHEHGMVPTLVGARSWGPSIESGTASAQPAAATFTHRTARGDSWWSVAETYLGDGLRWSDIRDLNLGRVTADGGAIDLRTETLRPGWDLRLPTDATAWDSDVVAPTQPGESVVTVEPGDHFWALAEERLVESWGRAPSDAEIGPYWLQVVAANEGRLLPPNDPNLIYPDQQFVLPPAPPNPDVDVDLNGDRVAVPENPNPLPPEPVVPTTPAPAPIAPSTSDTAPEPARPSTTAPADAAPVPESAEGEEADPSAGDHLGDLARPLLLLAGAGLLGSLLLGTLRWLRHIQAARRRPGTVIDPPDDQAAAYEREIRAISSDGEDARYLTATNRYLAQQLESHRAASLPAVVAARAGTHGVELLLDEPCEPVTGFVAANESKTSWRLAANVTARMMEADSNDAHPFAPGLLVVGTTEPGDLVLDFEQLGATCIEGESETVGAFQRALLASAISAPWGSQNRIVSIGLDRIEVGGRIEQPAEPIAWAEDIAEKTRSAAKRAERSPYEERVDHGMITFPTIVVIGPDPALAGVAQHLAPVAELAYSDLTLIAAAPIPTEHRIVIADGVASLEPQGIAFEPIGLTVDELAATHRLLVNAADTKTGPPTDWTEESQPGEDRPTQDDQPPNGEAADQPHDRQLSADASHIDDAPPDVASLIAEITAPQPVEVRLLGRKPTVEGLDGDASAKLEAIIAYLAFHREVSAQRLRDEFWSNSNGRTGADTAMMRIRSLLGSTADGSSRLPSARGNGTYQLVEVGCDWTRATRLLDAARTAASPEDEAALLDAACELIDGHIAADASPIHYSWLLRDPGTYTQMETALVDAAHRRAELALEAADLTRADWAARKGLNVVEGQESLHRVRMMAAAESGDTDGVNAAFREAQRAAESYGFDEEVQPETQALYESLVVRPAGGPTAKTQE